MATVLAVLPALYLAVFHVSYRRQRFLAFLDPWKDAKGTGYQLVQSLLALGSGGLWGKGAGESTIKMYYMPETQTDFIFPIFGAGVRICGHVDCYGPVFLSQLHLFKSGDPGGPLVHVLAAAGVGLWLGGQVLINLGVVASCRPRGFRFRSCRSGALRCWY